MAFVFKSSSTISVRVSVADCDGSPHYIYNVSGKALPDPSGIYRVEMTLPNGQVVTASFGLKP